MINKMKFIVVKCFAINIIIVITVKCGILLMFLDVGLVSTGDNCSTRMDDV